MYAVLRRTLVPSQFSSALQRASLDGRRGLSSAPVWHGTTILAVRKDNAVCVVGDGQVTMGSYVVKNNARKVRRLGPNDRVVAGFAGATADALTLFERLESKIEEHPEQLLRACVSLAKDWRMDKYLRRLDAMLLVCDRDISLYLTGTGDVLEPPDGVIGIGSGGAYAIAAARALIPVPGMTAEMIARSAMTIAADLCVYTNANFVVENIAAPPDDPGAGSEKSPESDASSSSSSDPPSSPEPPSGSNVPPLAS
jgi:ATP-dependent HslUV protease, peptidase subunit HslV